MNPGEIEIFDEPAQLAAARDDYRQKHEERLKHLLENPGEVTPWAEEDLKLLSASRDQSIASLSELRDNDSEPAIRRIEAIAALHVLGIAPNYQQFAELGGAYQEASKVLLLMLSRTDQPDLPEPLKTFLIHCVQSRDSHIRSLAANQIGSRQVHEAFDPLMTVIRSQMSEMPRPELCLLEAAARIRPSREILNLLRQQLFSDLSEWEREGALKAITNLGAATTDIALREEVSLICLEYLRGRPDTPSISGHVWGAVEFIAAVTPVEMAKARLCELVRTSAWKLLQDDALDELDKLDATLAAETGSRAGIELRRHRNSKSRMSSQSAMSTADVAAVLVGSGVLTQSEIDHAIIKSREKSTGPSGPSKEFSALDFMAWADKLALVNIKRDCHPVRHDQVLEEFAKASGGLFNPEAPLERYHSNQRDETANPRDSEGPGRWVAVGGGNYEIQFIHRGKLYRFAPKDQGRWIDIMAVLKAIHKTLEDAGVSERFAPLAESCEIGVFLFANPAALKNASRDVDLKLMEGFA